MSKPVSLFRSLFALLVVCGLPFWCVAASASDELQLTAFGKYGFYVTPAQAKASPSWNDALGDSPLSLENAALEAEKYVQAHGFPDAKFTRATLARLGDLPYKWYIVVKFEGRHDRALEQSAYGTVVLLMNKEIVPARLLPSR